MRHNSSYHFSAKDSFSPSRTHRKNTGTFYTPESLAKLIAQDAIFAWISNRVGCMIMDIEGLDRLTPSIQRHLLQDIKDITILDPAVGDGIFLISAGELISEIRLALGDKESREVVRKTTVNDSLFGVDLSKQAVESCIKRLAKWSRLSSRPRDTNIKVGNSLVGHINPIQGKTSTQDELDIELARTLNPRKVDEVLDELRATLPLHWPITFSQVFSDTSPGFDIILGNPPYGSILGSIERRYISSRYSCLVGGGRDGTWNSAAHFLVRCISLMKDGGQLGFLVPNSFLRVKQFSKTRNFLLSNTRLWKIVDEGSPFDEVTLEMVSIFCEQPEVDKEHEIRVVSRRHGLEQSNIVSSRILKESKVFPIYHDHIFEKILKRGKRHLLVAGRGRDIPKDHVRKKKTSKFKIPYITSGRSVQRYYINDKHVFFTDDWFHQDSALMESFESELLVATKNYRYPRCILKPAGMIHGGGIVRITPLYDNADLKVLGLILNSRLVRQISIRYLTNYSQLTCCLNTGIMEELPIKLPEEPLLYRRLFDKLSHLHSNQQGTTRVEIIALERLADALVYSLYFGDNGLEQRMLKESDDLCVIAQEPEVVTMVEEIFSYPLIKELKRLGSYSAQRSFADTDA
ncbi:MAG: Eco57I restriction-modification methylase domain-containing protein [Candidatus Thorarchaeota archaeon SMTZ1-45]|nr:MAG: hypothetical protein AM325_05250 [Candidatus Thorarchaeota archaeon SMTZ1-45]